MSLGVDEIFPPLVQPYEKSRLSLLIEAGQLAHKALLVPLEERGLARGDDAILFALSKGGMAQSLLAGETGIDDAVLDSHLERLIGRELVVRQAVGPKLVPGLALTERGERVRGVLAANWEELESALLGEMDKKDRKALERTLKRFVDLLRL